MKQTSYESGPNATRLLARLLRKQTSNTISMIKDPQTNQILHEEILQKVTQNRPQLTKTLSEIKSEEIQDAISRLKANISPGSDGLPSDWCRTFKNEHVSSFNQLSAGHFYCYYLKILVLAHVGNITGSFTGLLYRD